MQNTLRRSQRLLGRSPTRIEPIATRQSKQNTLRRSQRLLGRSPSWSASAREPLTTRILEEHTRATRRSVQPLPVCPPATSVEEDVSQESEHMCAFERNGILDVDSEPEGGPADLEEMIHRIHRERASPPPSEALYRQYQQRIDVTYSEAATAKLWTMLAKVPSRGDGYCDYYGIKWGSIEPFKGMPNPTPHVVEALPQNAYPHNSLASVVRTSYIGQDGFAMPSFAVQFDDDIPMYLLRQECGHIGALMLSSGMSSYKIMHGDIKDFCDKTKAITILFHADNMEIYLHHVLLDKWRAEEGLPPAQYHQTRIINDSKISEGYEAFMTAWKHVRNAQDLGYELAKDLQTRLRWYALKLELCDNPPNTPEEPSQLSRPFWPPPEYELIISTSGWM